MLVRLREQVLLRPNKPKICLLKWIGTQAPIASSPPLGRWECRVFKALGWAQHFSCNSCLSSLVTGRRSSLQKPAAQHPHQGTRKPQHYNLWNQTRKPPQTVWREPDDHSRVDVLVQLHIKATNSLAKSTSEHQKKSVMVAASHSKYPIDSCAISFLPDMQLKS